MPRLTRAESQARTRAELIATAREYFLRDGFAGTAIEEVAESAGYSRGAVYSNFANKEELCFVVLEQIFDEEMAAVSTALGTGDLGTRLGALQAWAERMVGDEGWTGLSAEFAAHARRDPALRKRFAAFDLGLRRTLAELLADAIEDLGLSPTLERDTLATAFLSLAIGLGMQRAVDPSISVGVLTDVVWALIDPKSND